MYYIDIADVWYSPSAPAGEEAIAKSLSRRKDLRAKRLSVVQM